MSIATYEQDINLAVPSTTGQAMLESPNISNNNGHPPRDLLGYRPNTQFARPADMRTTQRKPTPSPLQMESAMTADSQADNSPGISRSPTASRAESVSQYSSQSSRSPHSPRSKFPADPDLPDSSRDPLGGGTVTGSLATDKATNQSGDSGVSRKDAAVPPKTQSYGQLRNVSSPFPQTKPLRDSSPHSPSSTTSPPSTDTAIHPQSRSMPRTSSIDSAISTISTTTSHSHKSSQDSFLSNPADISHLINTAGSAEAVIQHLLKEKQHSTAQNGQLWRLVDKQRALLLGLNQDLERALKDKERYRKKLKEHIGQVPPVPSATSSSEPRATSQSHTASDTHNELPIQSNARQDLGLSYSRDPSLVSKPSNAVQEPKTNEAPAQMGEISTQVEKKTARPDSTTSKNPAPDSESTALSPSESRRAMPSLDTAFVSSDQNIQASNTVVSPSSFTAKRTQKVGPGSSPALMVSSPPGSNTETFSTPPRKLPPAPLDLRQPGREEVHLKPRYGPEDHSGSDYDEKLEVDEIIPSFDRGRKKTRAEDDQEREAAALKEKQDRSRSKKEKGSKTPSETSKAKASEVDLPIPTPMPPAIKAVSPPAEPAGGSSFLSQPPSLASVLTSSQSQQQTKVNRTFLSTQPLSPGLPVSPRPGDRPMNSPMPRMPRDAAGPSIASPPLSPRTGFVGLPLSPRAPKQPIPFPPETPMSISAPTPRFVEPTEPPDTTHISGFHFPQPVDASKQDFHPDPAALVSRESDLSRPKGVHKGFMSELYPDLLIPPNALPSIIIKVISSRLKPSRNSYLVNKGSEEEPVFTLGVSSRSELQELWQVEKSLHSLSQLDYQLKQSSTFGAKFPDHALFSGHAPAKIDARRIALERYFETILDTPMDDNAALVLCHYLSTQIVEGVIDEGNDNHSASGSPVTQGPDGRLLKEGYLTKRGKNFGGWKARFFVLDEPVLRYYESQGGSLLGTIKLPNAQIGKPLPHHASNSPSRGEDSDSQYRHAFLILEPKRKDSTSHVRHTLCAESDEERDAWVDALLYYVDDHSGDEPAKKPSISSNESGSSKIFAPQKRPSQRKDGSMTDSPQSDNFDGLQSVSYEDTVAAYPPLVHMIPDKRFAESPSPPNLGVQNSGGAQKPLVSKTISGPSNGAKIQDVGAWGNKPLAPSQAVDKEHKKRSIWGFHNKHPLETTAYSNESSLSLTQQQYYERISNVRPVFGLPLADAVEYCSPRGVDVCLPAVVFRCLEYLKAQDAWSEEGIFRLSGSNVVIKGLRDRFNNEGDFDFLADDNYYDVHAVASLLKLYLRELPSSILTRELHLDFLHVLGK